MFVDLPPPTSTSYYSSYQRSVGSTASYTATVQGAGPVVAGATAVSAQHPAGQQVGGQQQVGGTLPPDANHATASQIAYYSMLINQGQHVPHIQAQAQQPQHAPPHATAVQVQHGLPTDNSVPQMPGPTATATAQLLGASHHQAQGQQSHVIHQQHQGFII